MRSSSAVLIAFAFALIAAACEIAFPTHEAVDAGGDATTAPPKDASADAFSTNGDAQSATDGGGAAIDAGPPFASCSGLAQTCGATGNDNCCATNLVEAGTYYRSYDGASFTDKSYPATVSAFYLDTYEVTVGRFRKYFLASPPPPAQSSGKDIHNSSDVGWQSSDYNSHVNAGATLTSELQKCSGSNPAPTWTPTAGSNETLPINCLSWFEAFAFCIWDGGRLPTEAEWNLAATGGANQRVYPWSNPATSTAIDATDAVYASTDAGAVGLTTVAGLGFFGQSDLAGNVREWVVDWSANYTNPCNDCATVVNPLSLRVVRGGGFDSPSGSLLLTASMRDAQDPHNGMQSIGVRCARDQL